MCFLMLRRTPLLFGGALCAVGFMALRRRPPLSLRKWCWWVRQRMLRSWLVDDRDLVRPSGIRRIGGVDISFVKDSDSDACACLVVVDSDSLEVIHADCRRVKLTAPYVPGYLAFREVEFLLRLIDDLRSSAPHLLPDAILTDGNGILHPMRFGLACHLGGKALHHVDGLTKDAFRSASEGLRSRGDHALLRGASGAVWGALLRTSEPADGTSAFKPVVVSVGHGICLDSAVELVRRCTRHRIPEPVRQADLRSRAWLREHGSRV